jgi:hypothetical protein
VFVVLTTDVAGREREGPTRRGVEEEEELLAVWCHSELASVWWLPKLVIVGSVAYSASLNSYVNLLHAGWSRVTDPRKR